MGIRWAVLAAGLAACGGGVSATGDIDGERVPLKSGYFAREGDAYEGGDGEIYVMLSSLDDACDKDVEVNEALDDADDANDQEDAWQDLLPEDFWTITLQLRVSDVDDDQKGVVFDGVAWDETNEDDEEVFGTIIHYTDHLDEDYFSGNYDDYTDYFDGWYTDGGDLEVTKYKQDEKFGGRFETEVAQPSDGDTEGDLVIDFDVKRCAEMEKFLY